MEQHPIPQHISSYEFRLVGDMTLKQFFQLAGGIVVSLLFYASPLHPIIKWPLILFFAALGAALAFLPFEERPLEIWVVSFFKSIYSPTLYAWRKTHTEPKFFTDEVQGTPKQSVIAPQGEATLKNYLEVANQKSGFLKNLEDSENRFLKSLGSIFNPTLQKPTSQPQTASVPQPTPVFVQAASIQVPQPQVPENLQGKRFNIHIPTTLPTPINRPKYIIEEKLSPGQSSVSNIVSTQVTPLITPNQTFSSLSAQFSPDAAPPTPSTVPNIIVGQVLTPTGQIIEGAILEIRDTSGRPVKALKSNKLGHFMIVIPLQNGRYEIITEKDGFDFDPITFEATGVVIPPIAIHSRRGAVQVTQNNSVPNQVGFNN